MPVVVLHGGPRRRVQPNHATFFFDPAHYRVILFDQRGCGRSKPSASTHENTTAHLLADIELIRKHAGDFRAGLCSAGLGGQRLRLPNTQAQPQAVAA